ncbi:MAG: 2-isopropylmalate synthase [Oligoflexia bacterium]|nr:2-isopropylmalate synthase [Oligoflexia bacterium]
MKIEILDTTLRDGEQTSGVAFSAAEKLSIAIQLLKDTKVDRIEIASARVSQGEFESVKKITEWAAENGFINNVEVLGFVDGTKSLDWINEAGAKVINLLCKGSLKHLKGQLRKKPEEHIADIKKSINYANSLGINVNLYLEDWSNGMKNSRDYVFRLVDELRNENIQRFMLPDTLGILSPDETYEFCKIMIEKYSDLKFDFHAHNDYDLAVGNSLAAVRADITGIHTTVNGLGERSGNTTLSSIVAAINDHLDVKLSVDESNLRKISKIVEAFTGIKVPGNKPIIGENVFTQCCGVHADGDDKENLYHNDLLPERFGRIRKYALGKTSGKASIKKNLQALGIELDPESMDKVTQKVIELGDKKEYITTEDLPYIISDVLGTGEISKNKIKIKSYYTSNVSGVKPTATINVEINDTIYEETSLGDGQYDAFMKALGKVYEKLGKKLPGLTDYAVTIPPGGKTDALVKTEISWIHKGKEFKTRGLDSDQTGAAIQATIKMLNIIEPE